jgi:orotate phosphoribosyltransferase
LKESLFVRVARMIWERAAIKFDLAKGFPVKHHEKYPDAPSPPIYMSLRLKGKKGTLLPEDFDLIAELIWREIEKAIKSGEIYFTAIAGIPTAGSYLIEALRRIVPDLEKRFRIVDLDKIETKEGRRIVLKKGFEYRNGERILLIDDVVSWATSSIEAIMALLSAGSNPIAICFYLDREEGGKELLEKMGIEVVSCNTMSALLSLYYFKYRLDLIFFKAYKEYAEKSKNLLLGQS